MPELTWLQDRKVFYRYIFAQCLGNLAHTSLLSHEAIERAEVFAIAATIHVFGEL